MKLLIPFLVWSSVYTFIKLLFSNEPINILKSFLKLLLGLSSGQLYYIVVLLQLTVLIPYLIKAIENNKKAKHLFLITPLYLIVLYSFTLIYNKQLPYFQYLFPVFFSFYYLGLWIKIKGFKPLFKTNKVRNSILFYIFGLIICIFEAYFMLYLKFPESFASSQTKISSHIYVIAIINLLITIKPYFEDTSVLLLKNIGDKSYGIFYVHIIWIIISNKLLYNVTILRNVLLFHQTLQLFLTITLSYLTIIMTKKLLGEKNSLKYFGFS